MSKSNIIGRLLTCGECKDGLVPAKDLPEMACNCGSPADESVNYMHERYCGYEPCPNGCWWKLHPYAPGSPQRRHLIVQLWTQGVTSLKPVAAEIYQQSITGNLSVPPPAGVKAQGGRDRKFFGHVRCWARLRWASDGWRPYWSAGQEGHCAVWGYATPWGALWNARGLHRDRSGLRAPRWARALLRGLVSTAIVLAGAIAMGILAMFAAGHP